MPRKYGDCMAFSGGAEPTPTVHVMKYRQPGSLHDGDPTFLISQGQHSLHLSPETMRAILQWYDQGED